LSFVLFYLKMFGLFIYFGLMFGYRLYCYRVLLAIIQPFLLILKRWVLLVNVREILIFLDQRNLRRLFLLLNVWTQILFQWYVPFVLFYLQIFGLFIYFGLMFDYWLYCCRMLLTIIQPLYLILKRWLFLVNVREVFIFLDRWKLRRLFLLLNAWTQILLQWCVKFIFGNDFNPCID